MESGARRDGESAGPDLRGASYCPDYEHLMETSPSEFTALAVAAGFPPGKSLFEFMRRRQVDPISVVVLFGIAADCMALFAGGSPRLLLIRESIFTGAFAVTCLASLLLPRPMMFYFGRHFIAGADAGRRARFCRSVAVSLRPFLSPPYYHRFGMRVYGGAFVADCPHLHVAGGLGAGGFADCDGRTDGVHHRLVIQLRS